jgi:hypothetical protein
MKDNKAISFIPTAKNLVRGFIDSAIDSLLAASRIFDDPFFPSRQETILMLLNHAFEMLLKAAVLKKTGRLRAKGEKHNYSFAKCLGICFLKLELFNETSLAGLKIINSLRDAAVHDTLQLNEGILAHFYVMAVIIFHDILKRVSAAKQIERRIPLKKILIESRPAEEFNFYVRKDFAAAKKMLKLSKKRAEEALIKLRPYLIVENELRETAEGRAALSEALVIKMILRGKTMENVLPFVSSLFIGPYHR